MPDPIRRLAPGAAFPPLALPLVGGGLFVPALQPGWCLLVVYRGRHCGLCRRYLDTLESLLPRCRALAVRAVAVSADPPERVRAQLAQTRWTFPVAHSLDLAQMRLLGLYVSTPLSPEETDRPFAEPALFVLDAGRRLHIVCVANSPYARPRLDEVLDGIETLRRKQYPARGTLA